MNKLLALSEKIKSSLLIIEEKLRVLSKENSDLKTQNFELKSECQNALFEVEKCLTIIESLQIERNGNNNS